jgi:HSP20 family molecular chaperone IbpA
LANLYYSKNPSKDDQYAVGVSTFSVICQRFWLDKAEGKGQCLLIGDLSMENPIDHQTLIRWNPSVDIIETKDCYEVKYKNYHRIERRYGKFQRIFYLPNHIKADGIKAYYKNGVLTVNIPKNETKRNSD